MINRAHGFEDDLEHSRRKPILFSEVLGLFWGGRGKRRYEEGYYQ